MSACYDPTRRKLLKASASFAAWSLLPTGSALSASADPRLLVVFLRGALDGLASVMPVGDPFFEKRRESFIDNTVQFGQPLTLDGFFALSPHLTALNRLYSKKQALIIHAIASPYRERSHFDGQDVVETGLAGVGRTDSGWMNRLLGTLQASNQRISTNGLYVGASTPLIMTGQNPVMSYAPVIDSAQLDDTATRLLALYQDQSPEMAEALGQALQLQDMTAMKSGVEMQNANNQGNKSIAAMLEAASLMASDEGPRIAAMSLDGWDTHARANPGTGLLGNRLKDLNTLIEGLETALAPVWEHTTIALVTEFGRTVNINGTDGTDHGTGTNAILIGGAVKGGRVVSDWPGLGDKDLLQKRDLKPTADLRGLFKGVLKSRFDVSDKALNDVIFPQSSTVPAMLDLVQGA